MALSLYTSTVGVLVILNLDLRSNIVSPCAVIEAIPDSFLRLRGLSGGG